MVDEKALDSKLNCSPPLLLDGTKEEEKPELNVLVDLSSPRAKEEIKRKRGRPKKIKEKERNKEAKTKGIEKTKTLIKKNIVKKPQKKSSYRI